MQGNRVLIPAGSTVRGIVRSVDKAGNIDRTGKLTPRRPLSTCSGAVGSMAVELPLVPLGVVDGGLLLMVSAHPTHPASATAASIAFTFMTKPPRALRTQGAFRAEKTTSLASLTTIEGISAAEAHSLFGFRYRRGGILIC